MRLLGGENTLTAGLRAFGLLGLVLTIIAGAAGLLGTAHIIQGVLGFLIIMVSTAGLDWSFRDEDP